MISVVSRDGGTRYQVYGRRAGKKVYVGTFDTRKLAAAADEDFRVTQRKIDAGELPPGHDQRRTFEVAGRLWLAELRKAKSRSVDEYASCFELYMLKTFAAVPLTSIGKLDVIRWREAAHLAHLSNKTKNMTFGVLSSAFTFFVEQDFVAANPCRGVKQLPVKTKTFPWLQSGEAITRLLAECSPACRNVVAVLVGTGMRLDEALHLQWDDVDLEHRIITVHRGRKGTTKSGRMRYVPIFDSVLPLLKEMRLARGSNKLLWPGGKRGKPHEALSQPSIRAPFKRAIDHAGLPSDMRLHDLRHTFASLFLIDGGDIFKLSRILGHSSVTITERTYAHLKPDAYDDDYKRVRFAMPTVAKVLPFGRQQGDAAR